MLQSQYMRIETVAGGLNSTNREFIRACHTVLSKEGKSQNKKQLRHSWIKAGLLIKEGL